MSQPPVDMDLIENRSQSVLTDAKTIKRTVFSNTEVVDGGAVPMRLSAEEVEGYRRIVSNPSAPTEKLRTLLCNAKSLAEDEI